MPSAHCSDDENDHDEVDRHQNGTNSADEDSVDEETELKELGIK